MSSPSLQSIAARSRGRARMLAGRCRTLAGHCRTLAGRARPATMTAPVRVAIISDTHLPRGDRRLGQRCIANLREAELILHAGDIATASALAMLASIGTPVEAVHGNVDEDELKRALAAELEVELEGVRMAMLHDAGPARGRMQRLRARFPAAALVVFGHSHLPLHETGLDGLQIFNPGSPTERRRAPTHTMGMATVVDGRVTALTHVEV